MRFLPLLGVLVLAGTALSQQADLQVMKTGPDGVVPGKMLYNYLQGQAQKHFDARRKAVAALKTPEDVKRRQDELRAKFIEALGGFPEKTPLNAKVVGKDQRDGYRIERVVYESRPDHHVTAKLYLPDGKPPFPGVLVPCGHSANGKAAEAYQRACILLAKNGLAVLCYDPIGQGERSPAADQGRQAGHRRQHVGAHDGRRRRPAGRPEHGRRTASGTASAASTTSPAGRRSIRSGSAAPATPAAAR